MTYKKVPTEEILPDSRHGFGSYQNAVRAVLLLAVLILCAVILWPLQAAAFNQEGGPIETISAAGLFAAGLVALVRYPGVSRLYIGLVCLLLAERELEASIYVEGSAPFVVLDSLDILLDMTVVRIVLAVLVLGGVFWHGVPNGWRALKLRAPFLAVFVLAGTSAVIAQLLEEVSGMYDAELSATMVTRLFVLEETLELFFSIGILAAVLIGWPKSQIKETVHDPDIAPIADTR
ncbi:hypothetical protein HW561_08525 [Rhodobacteraceae bacterium B1Z28]|uniref:Uncharacterized protein n=1 Tax=Ruegeria haliotis TaxID=2747601 RepID=A0ABX2PQ80_9RHOB|nr:hypothetical protein [Ruegeria haliotis]NVO55831.1 hypothetical protein [Ruegeria haliotis]